MSTLVSRTLIVRIFIELVRRFRERLSVGSVLKVTWKEKTASVVARGVRRIRVRDTVSAMSRLVGQSVIANKGISGNIVKIVMRVMFVGRKIVSIVS
jgi:hypothetical protein